MKVLHLSTSDISGGAAIAAFRLHRALCEAGVSSSMAVASRRSNDPDVFEVSSPSDRKSRWWRRLDQERLSAELRRSARRVSPTLEYFSDDRVAGPDPLANLPSADVIHLHWVANQLDYSRFFGRLRPGQPVVWTLHDMNPFTGGCHYSMGCKQFLSGCGRCPQLGSSINKDITHRIFQRKLAALTKLDTRRTCIVAPSSWLADEARRSPLFGRFRVEVVPNSLDTDVFRPRDRRIAREVFDLPQDRPILLFVSDHLHNYRKGFDLLQIALAGFPAGFPVTLVAIGTGAGGLPKGTIPLGRIESERLMSFAYSAADALVLPTRSDNLPNVVIEALACALPTVSFHVGGLPDLVSDGRTGFLAAPEKATSLGEKLFQILTDGEARKQMGATAREAAVQTHGNMVIATRYKELYTELAEN